MEMTQFYFLDTKLTMQERLLRRPPRAPDPSGLTSVQRIRDLDTVLTCIEGQPAAFTEMAPSDWTSVTVDRFTQSTHCLGVLFKLTTLEEPGWDVEGVRRRADVLGILDHACEIMRMHRVPAAVGTVDARTGRGVVSSPRRRILCCELSRFFFLSELPPSMVSVVDSGSGGGSGGSSTNTNKQSS